MEIKLLNIMKKEEQQQLNQNGILNWLKCLIDVVKVMKDVFYY